MKGQTIGRIAYLSVPHLLSLLSTITTHEHSGLSNVDTCDSLGRGLEMSLAICVQSVADNCGREV